MRRVVAVLALVVAPTFACSDGAVAGNGVAKKERRDVGAFAAIDLTGHAAVVVEAGAPAIAVEVSGDENVVPMVTTTVKGDVLTIGWKDGVGARTKLPLRVDVKVPALRAAKVSGAGSTTVRGLTGAAFDASVSGAGSLLVAGAVDALTATVSGAGHVDAEKLAAKDVHASVSGAGGVVVAPTEKLKADVSGVGSVRYVGAPPTIEKNVTGVGSVGPK